MLNSNKMYKSNNNNNNILKKMEEKRKAIEKVILSRRTMTTIKFMEESKLCSVALLQLQRTHLQALEQLHFLHTAKISLAFEKSTCKKKKKIHTFWEKECQLADETIFRHRFRMSRNAFNKLCELLSGLQQGFKHLSKGLTLQKGVAIALYALGSAEEYRKIGKMFGVKEATVINIILKFSVQVWKMLAPIYLSKFPLTKENMESLMEGFETLGFPQCLGALVSCQIAMKSQSDSCAKNSFVLLSLVDAKCRFIYVNCGNPGNCSDSQIYQQSSLKQYLDRCNLLLELQKNISDVDVPVLLVGDSSFQLSEELMTPYPSISPLTKQQKLFNHVLSKSLKTAQNAILQLKARFRRLEKGIDSTIKNSIAITLSCCVLHNFLQENNDVVNEDWLQSLQITDPKGSHIEQSILPTHSANNAKAIRLAISSYIAGHHISDAYNNDEYEELDPKSGSESFKGNGEAANSSVDRNDDACVNYDNESMILNEYYVELMSE